MGCTTFRTRLRFPQEPATSAWSCRSFREPHERPATLPSWRSSLAPRLEQPCLCHLFVSSLVFEHFFVWLRLPCLQAERRLQVPRCGRGDVDFRASCSCGSWKRRRRLKGTCSFYTYGSKKAYRKDGSAEITSYTLQTHLGILSKHRLLRASGAREGGGQSNGRVEVSDTPVG